MIFEEFFESKKIIVQLNNLAKDSYSVTVSTDDTKVLCVLSIGAESNLNFKPLNINVIERASAVDKIPYGFKKRDVMSDNGVIMSRMIDRVFRPLIDEKFSRSMNLYVNVIKYKSTSILSLAVLGGSLLFNIVKLIKSPVSLIKISDEKVNCCNSLNKKFSFYHAICDDKTVMMDFEGLDVYSLNSDIFKNSYRVAAKCANKMNSFQNFVLQKTKKIDLHTKKSSIGFFENLRIFSKVDAYLKAIKENNFEELYKLDAFLEENNYYYNLLFKKKLIENYKNFIKRYNKRLDFRSLEEVRPMIFNYESSNTISLSFGRSECLTSFLSSDLSNVQMIESLDGSFKTNFLVQYLIMPYANLSFANKISYGFVSRKEIEYNEYIRRSFSLFVKDQSKVFRVAIDVLNNDGSSIMTSVASSSLLLKKFKSIEHNIVAISLGVIFDKKEFILADLNKFEENLFCDVVSNFIGNDRQVFGFQIDARNSLLNFDQFSRLIDTAYDKIADLLTIMESFENCEYISKKNDKNININDNFKVHKSSKNDKKNEFYDLKKGKNDVLQSEMNHTKKDKENINEDDLQLLKRYVKIDITKIGMLIGTKGAVIKGISKKFNTKINVSDDGEVVIIGHNHDSLSSAVKYIKELLK